MNEKIQKLASGLYIMVFISMLLALPGKALADVQSGLNQIQSSFGTYGGITSATNVNTLIGQIISALLFIVGAIAVLFLIIGGFWYITSAGNEETAEKGRKTIINALIGIVVVILSYVIVNVIVNLVTGSSSFF